MDILNKEPSMSAGKDVRDTKFLDGEATPGLTETSSNDNTGPHKTGAQPKGDLGDNPGHSS